MIFICVSKIFIFNKKLYTMRLTNYLLASLIMFSFNLYAQSDKDKDEKKKNKENKNLPIKPFAPARRILYIFCDVKIIFY